MKSRILVLLGIVLGWSDRGAGSKFGEEYDEGDAKNEDPSKQRGNTSCDNIQDESGGVGRDRPGSSHDVPTSEIANRSGTGTEEELHERPCSLFMAPSGVEGAGFGMYTASAPRNGDVVRCFALSHPSDNEMILRTRCAALTMRRFLFLPNSFLVPRRSSSCSTVSLTWSACC